MNETEADRSVKDPTPAVCSSTPASPTTGGLKLDTGGRQNRPRPRALIIRDRQTFGEIPSGRAGGIDAHLGQREGLRVRRGVEYGAFGPRNEDDVLVRPHPRGECPHHVVDVEDVHVVVN